VPVHLAGVRAADDRDQCCLGVVTGVAEAAVDADRDVDDVARLQRDLALGLAFQPEHVPRPLGGNEHLLGRVAVQCRAVALRRMADIGHGKAVRGCGDLRLQIGVVEVLDHAHADDVDDLALIARHPLVEKSQLGALHRGEAGDMAPLHPFHRDDGRRLALQAGIDIGHGVPPLVVIAAETAAVQ
jgi:hypothetical protein